MDSRKWAAFYKVHSREYARTDRAGTVMFKRVSRVHAAPLFVGMRSNGTRVKRGARYWFEGCGSEVTAFPRDTP